MLETPSLRMAFGVVALTMLALFYLVSYRSTRSAYAAWWCAALALFVSGASLHQFDDTAQQAWAVPSASALVVGGAGAVWAGTRSLWRTRTPWWWIALGPACAGVVAMLDDPGTNVWAGGPIFLSATSLLLGLAAVELWRHGQAYRPGSADSGTYRLALGAMTIACALVAGYFGCRCLAYLAVGWRDELFTTFFGDQATTLVSTVLLATASFSMSLLSNEQQNAALRKDAAHDGLTGLLNRAEFLRLAAERVEQMHRQDRTAQLILADLDHFKLINDELGHLAGDQAIQTFADACTDAVRTTDLVGRYGGEEFILMLVGATPDRATQVTDAIDAAMVAAAQRDRVRLPTVSYGIATLDANADLMRTIGHADTALYRAKAVGRNRSVHFFPGVG